MEPILTGIGHVQKRADPTTGSNLVEILGKREPINCACPAVRTILKIDVVLEARGVSFNLPREWTEGVDSLCISMMGATEEVRVAQWRLCLVAVEVDQLEAKPANEPKHCPVVAV